MEVRSMFAERRVQINRYWKEEGFVSLDHALLIAEIMGPYTSRSVQLACPGDMKGKYKRKSHKIENEDKMIGPNPN